MDYLFFVTVGITMGFLGGLLGIGGSIVMIPALVFAFGENQHLYQAAAMICIFFVSGAALIAHRKAKAISKEVLIRLIPAAMLGILGGVALSNCSFFEGDRDYLLARLFGGFLAYVAFYNALRLIRSMKQHRNLERDEPIEKPGTIAASSKAVRLYGFFSVPIPTTALGELSTQYSAPHALPTHSRAMAMINIRFFMIISLYNKLHTLGSL